MITCNGWCSSAIMKPPSALGQVGASAVDEIDKVLLRYPVAARFTALVAELSICLAELAQTQGVNTDNALALLVPVCQRQIRDYLEASARVREAGHA